MEQGNHEEAKQKRKKSRKEGILRRQTMRQNGGVAAAQSCGAVRGQKQEKNKGSARRRGASLAFNLFESFVWPI